MILKFEGKNWESTFNTFVALGWARLRDFFHVYFTQVLILTLEITRKCQKISKDVGWHLKSLKIHPSYPVCYCLYPHNFLVQVHHVLMFEDNYRTSLLVDCLVVSTHCTYINSWWIGGSSFHLRDGKSQNQKSHDERVRSSLSEFACEMSRQRIMFPQGVSSLAKNLLVLVGVPGCNCLPGPRFCCWKTEGSYPLGNEPERIGSTQQIWRHARQTCWVSNVKKDEKSVKISAMLRLFSTYWSQILVGCSREICLQPTVTGHSLKALSFVGESGCPQFLAAYASLFLLVHAQYCSSCINVYYYMYNFHPGWMNPDYQLVGLPPK